MGREWEVTMRRLVRHCNGKPAATDRPRLQTLSHSFTLDANIYVHSERAGRRVMERVSRFLSARLKLRVNRTKSAVDKPQNRKLLGFTFTGGQQPNRRKIAPHALARFKARVRRITRRTWGISLGERINHLARYLVGWR